MTNNVKFNIEKFIEDIFAPGKNEIITIMMDLPHKDIPDNEKWRKRREMALRWHSALRKLSKKWDMFVNDIVTYQATGGNNSDLPDICEIGGVETKMTEIIRSSTIIISMPEFSATAPLYEYSLSEKKLRIGSMPGAEEFMEETGLSADYKKISEKCHILYEILKEAIGAEVNFSTGHFCYFDIHSNKAMIDDGILHPEMGGTEMSLSNLPAGEVCIVPEEGPGSLTEGELPFFLNGDLAVCEVKKNKIISLKGDGELIEDLREKFNNDKAWRNIAEFAIGVNDKAVVTGNVLQDEKAGFHWAFGRSDHLGGTVGVKDFILSSNVVHEDKVYAKGNSVVCSRLDVLFENGRKKTIIKNGILQI